MNEYKRTTGTVQFSSFGGWQIAANALYAYSHSSLDSVSLAPAKYKSLHRIVNQHMIWLNHYSERPDSHIGIYYQWNDMAPLKIYMRYYWKNDSTTDNFKRYAVMGELYSGYGIWIIERHPINYIRYFVLPNLIDYYAPPTEFMSYYNMGFDSISSTTVSWFSLTNNKVSNHFRSKTINLPDVYSILVPIINVIFIGSLMSLLSLRVFSKKQPATKRILQIALLVWAATMLFSAFTAYVILRYEIFSMILTLSFTIICLSILLQKLHEGSEDHYKKAESTPF